MPTILIVDDEYGIAEIVGDILSAHGYAVVTAANGQVALGKMTETRPDVILLDVMMPVMNGPELLRALRGSDEFRHIPVIMMSAVGREALSHEDAAHANGFLAKPFTFDDLMTQLGRVLDPPT